MTDTQKRETKDLRNRVLYISTAIAIGDYEASHLVNKLDELIELVKSHSFKYTIKYSHDSRSISRNMFDQHVPTLSNKAKQNKAMVISTLEDVQRELSSVKPNDRSALFMIRRILTSDFFQSELQNRMMKEHVTTRKAIFVTGELII